MALVLQSPHDERLITLLGPSEAIPLSDDRIGPGAPDDARDGGGGMVLDANVDKPIDTRPWPAPEAALRTSHHLTPGQIRFFDDNGYLVLRQWVPGGVLARMQAAGHAWIEQGMRLEHDESDFSFQVVNGQRTMFRVSYVHDKKQPASLELLGCPQVLAVAESLCGPNFVPTYESMVFKQQGNGAPIEWHQDACHPRRYRIFNYDLYLDESKVGAGALKVIPKSNREEQDVCRLASDHGWSPPGAVDVPMAPGDVLLHDVMIVHGSQPTQGNALRRTIYYEFRAAEEILDEGPWDREWISRRMRLVPLALRRHRRAYPQADQFAWGVTDDFRPAMTDDEDAELRVAHIVHTPGSYCSAGNVPERP